MTWIFWVVWLGANVMFFLLPKPECWAFAVAADVAFIAVQILWAHSWPGAAVGALILAYSLWQWWRNRRKPKRTGEILGAKARALRAALVRTMGERAVPGKPAPAGQRLS